MDIVEVQLPNKTETNNQTGNNHTRNLWGNDQMEKDLNSLREHMRSLELEHIKSRMTLLEQSVMQQRPQFYQCNTPLITLLYEM